MPCCSSPKYRTLTLCLKARLTSNLCPQGATNPQRPLLSAKAQLSLYGVNAVTQLSFRLGPSISKAVAEPPHSKKGEHLFGAVKFYVIAPMIEPIVPRPGARHKLQWDGTLHFRVLCRGRLQDIVRSDVHHYKFVSV